MKNIHLEKNQIYILGEKIYIIKSGKIITKDILETGKIIKNEIQLSAGEIVGNFFKFSLLSDFKISDMEIEIMAVEDKTVLEELPITKEYLQKNPYLQKIIYFLLKKVLLKIFYQLYDTKGYVLAVLKLLQKDKKFIYRKDIHYENFNISKSQFYFVYNALKKENYFVEVNDRVYFNKKKMDNYLNLLGDIKTLKKNNKKSTD